MWEPSLRGRRIWTNLGWDRIQHILILDLQSSQALEMKKNSVPVGALEGARWLLLPGNARRTFSSGHGTKVTDGIQGAGN